MKSKFELNGESGELHCTLPHGDVCFDVVSHDWVRFTSITAMDPNGEWVVLGSGVRPILKLDTSLLGKPWPLALVLPPKQNLLLCVEPPCGNAYREFVFKWERVEPETRE